MGFLLVQCMSGKPGGCKDQKSDENVHKYAGHAELGRYYKAAICSSLLTLSEDIP